MTSRTTPARPPDYPAQYEQTVRLEDGRTVWLRPVVPEDLAELKQAIENADPETLRRRFLGGSPPHTPAGLLRLVVLDYVRRFAMAAFAPDGTGVGIARYEGQGTWPAVDLAVAVDPAWRGAGLGRALVHAVVRRAVEQGAQSLTADFYADNRQVLGLLAETELPQRSHIEKGVVAEEVSLAGLAEPSA